MKPAAGWLYWVAYQLLGLAIGAVGLVVLLPMAGFKLWYTRPSISPMFAGRTVTAWRGGWLTLVFGNEEDGVTGPDWFTSREAAWPAWLRAYVWSAVRNYANNQRLWWGASFKTVAADITVTTYSWGSVTTQGWRQCVVWKGLRFGWLIPGKTDGDNAWPVAERM